MTQAQPFDFFLGSPYWIIVGCLLFSVWFIALAVVLVWEKIGPKPSKSVTVDGTTIELWERERKLPRSSDAIIVPVATDLKMAVGISKWVRDTTANAIQYEALRAAPLAPGNAFVGSGGKFRFGSAALAVVMDDTKRTSNKWITDAVAKSLTLLRDNDAEIITIPDFTEDLLRQPKWISDTQRQETCAPIARAIIDGIIAGGADVIHVRIWAWRGNVDVWKAEFERLQGESKNVTVLAATV